MGLCLGFGLVLAQSLAGPRGVIQGRVTDHLRPETSTTNGGYARPAYQYHFKNITIAPASAEEPRIQRFSPKLASDYVERGSLAWTGERQCVSCHTNGSYMVVRPLLTMQ